MVYVRGKNLRWGCSADTPRVLVVVNKGDKPETLDVPMRDTALAGCRKASSLWGAEAPVEIGQDTLHVVLSAGSVEVVEVN